MNILDEFEELETRVNKQVADTAKAVAAFRGTSMYLNYNNKYEYEFDNFERTNSDHYQGEYHMFDEVLYPAGIPLVRAVFGCWAGDSYETISIMFPELYLEQDWENLERPYVEKRDEYLAARAAERQKKYLAERRKQLEALKKELGE
jgi:hypothetical protein